MRLSRKAGVNGDFQSNRPFAANIQTTSKPLRKGAGRARPQNNSIEEACVNSIVDQMKDEKGQRAQAIMLRRREDLFENDRLKSIEARASSYLRAGVPVHFRGPAGTGKTTLAMQIAASFGVPTILITGDGWLTSDDLIGQETGRRHKHVVDNFVHNVRKVQTETSGLWADNALTTAIESGYTLIYDEFTRSPPRANTPLLMALEEGTVILPSRAGKDVYIRAHPDFRAIFTSNPEDYAGVMAPQDALLDRMITFDLTGHDHATEVGIVAAKSGLEAGACETIVSIVRALRFEGSARSSASLRAAIMIARIVKAEALLVSQREPRFVQLCVDVLEANSTKLKQDGRSAAVLERFLGKPPAVAAQKPNDSSAASAV
ncbi:gas vesicle protein GvpN [Rhodoblastus sphagnicola]|uniref:Gas vesicle protein GvpN n=1 Tax=Rhodoblastus sphagnicola TaxID=333368 RepID=A0A2S6MZN1_9HYPH|nr:gas vesicle protein GvpN [Rhodoblastus sphagnicola]